MNTRDKFLNYIKDAQGTMTSVNLPNHQLSCLYEDILDGELIVPVVGGFSAGKSTLINSFLNHEILPTAVTPETALATELRYAQESYIEAVTAENNVECYELSDFSNLKDNAKQFKNLCLYLNNDRLKDIEPLVLVDMPGFDAPIENHNQAILRYLERGVYFIFLTSVEDGNITLSMHNEINNLQRFSKGFSFCISKTNLRTSDDVCAIQQTVAEQLADDFDYTDEVVLLDMNGGNNLKNILKAINPEHLFSTLFLERLQENYHELVQSINLKIATFKTGKQEADEAVQDLKNSLQTLIQKKQAALAEAEGSYSRRKVDSIAEKVSQELLLKKDKLVQLVLHNQDAFSREVNDLVKHSLLREVNNSFQDISGKMIQDFGSHLKLAWTNNNGLLDAGLIDRIQAGAEMLLNRASSGLNDLSRVMNDKKPSSTTLYRTVATIVGLTTTVVSPILEILIVFLPDIIRLFTQHTREQKMREQAEQAIVAQVIPEIKSKIKDALPEIFQEHIAMVIEQISSQFEGQLQKISMEIQAAEAEKSQHAQELAGMIEQLNTAKQQLSESANRYLFS